MKIDLERHPRLTERVIQMALARQLQWWHVVVVPNWCRYHEMDLAVLTRAGYLWEYEIKIDQNDWNTDCRKDELPKPDRPPMGWNRPTRDLRYVKRFNYVYACGLLCPDWVPEWAGLLEVDYRTWGGKCHVVVETVRQAKDRKVERLPDDAVRRLYSSAYHRFWRLLNAEFHGDGAK